MGGLCGKWPYRGSKFSTRRAWSTSDVVRVVRFACRIKRAASYNSREVAVVRKERVGLGHFMRMLDAMDEFTEQFEGMKGAADTAE